MQSASQIENEVAGESIKLHHSIIHRNPKQPRQYFDEEKLKKFASNIDESGQIQPVVVRPHPEKPGEYMLIVGERRWRAVSLYCRKVKTLDAIVRYDMNTSPNTSIRRHSLFENMFREDLHYLELAEAFREIMEEENLNQKELTSLLEYDDPGYVNRYLSLLKLTPEARAYCDPALPKGRQLPFATAYAISLLDDPQDQVEMAKFAVERGARVLDVQNEIHHRLDARGAQSKRRRKGAHKSLKAHVERLSTVVDIRLGTVDAVFATFYGHVTPEETEKTMELVRELERKLKLLLSRLSQVRERQDASRGRRRK